MESPLSSLRRLLSRFSSPPTPVSVSSRSFFSGGPADESIAYRQSMFRRPGAVRPWTLRKNSCWNSCSFIGTLVYPVKRFAWRSPLLGAYTVLEVNRPSGDPVTSSFRILLKMRDKMAEISLHYLKPNDFVYVSGLLSSYEKVNGIGKNEIYHEVLVKDLNYVRHRLPSSSALDEQRAPPSNIGTPDHDKERRERLHLWQVFFASPYEWWDNRQGKLNPRGADFKHKDTKECLWIKPDDPPWIRKQLQLQDSKMATGHPRGLPGRGQEWKLEDMDF